MACRLQAEEAARAVVTPSDLTHGLVARPDVGEALKDIGFRHAVRGLLTEALRILESPLARFRAQYDDLPKSNILAADSTWEAVEARLSDPANADKLRNVQNRLQGGGRLYAVMEDGSLKFMDDNSEAPPMFVKDNETGELRIIFNRNEKEMAEARVQIEAETHQWGSVYEMLEWAKQNGFEVFERDTRDARWFGREMKLAEAASPNKLFVGQQGGPWMATALKEALYAIFDPDQGVVVHDQHLGHRNDDLGLLRRLHI